VPLSQLRRSLVGGAAVLTLLVGSAAAGSDSGPAPQPAQLPSAGDPAAIVDLESMMEDPDCETAQLLGPAATSTAHVGGGADKIVLDTLVLVDVEAGARIASLKNKRQRAAAEKALFGQMRDRLEAAAVSYEPLGIELRLSRFALLQPLDAKGKPRKRTDDATEIIGLSKKQFGGKRPAGIDIVYTITDLDIQVPGIGKAVAGLADCIGGVAHDDRAFAVGETVEGDVRKSSVPLNLGRYSAKIAAHEIGHLMGAHHHYQECGTPVPTAVAQGEVGPCSLMTNLANFLTLPFSQLNAIVVRGHAEQFATATDAARR
jgi:hypothetical protein